jgi:hypothetical protein
MMRVASLLLAHSLLTSAATAYAACAWVLWQEQGRIGGAEVVAWTPIGAGAGENACRQSLAAQVNSQRGQADAEIKGNNMVFWKAGPGLTMTYRYVCLPDTVDPRGPKGK